MNITRAVLWALEPPPTIQVSGLDFHIEIRFAGNFSTKNILVAVSMVSAPFNRKN